jgi:hypothetical protein
MFDKYSTDPRNSLDIPVSNRHATEVVRGVEIGIYSFVTVELD